MWFDLHLLQFGYLQRDCGIDDLGLWHREKWPRRHQGAERQQQEQDGWQEDLFHSHSFGLSTTDSREINSTLYTQRNNPNTAR